MDKSDGICEFSSIRIVYNDILNMVIKVKTNASTKNISIHNMQTYLINYYWFKNKSEKIAVKLLYKINISKSFAQIVIFTEYHVGRDMSVNKLTKMENIISFIFIFLFLFLHLSRRRPSKSESKTCLLYMPIVLSCFSFITNSNSNINLAFCVYPLC